MHTPPPTPPSQPSSPPAGRAPPSVLYATRLGRGGPPARPRRPRSPRGCLLSLRTGGWREVGSQRGAPRRRRASGGVAWVAAGGGGCEPSPAPRREGVVGGGAHGARFLCPPVGARRGAAAPSGRIAASWSGWAGGAGGRGRRRGGVSPARLGSADASSWWVFLGCQAPEGGRRTRMERRARLAGLGRGASGQRTGGSAGGRRCLPLSPPTLPAHCLCGLSSIAQRPRAVSLSRARGGSGGRGLGGGTLTR